jgi:methylmalonyl-CoA/ethylmalonyl-CoA epimerase
MEKSNGISLSQIGQVGIKVKDLDRAIEFYANKLGIQFLFQVPEMAFFDCQGVRLLLGTPAVSSSDQGTSIIYFKVSDIHSAYEALNEKGVEFVREPHLINRADDHELWMAFFKDVDENLLAIMSEIPLSTGE